MAVKAYITRDPQGNPWPPVHEHEARGVIGLIQRLHEALNHEKTMYSIFANLQSPSADLIVVSELGLGVVELKHYAGQLRVQYGFWHAGQLKIKAGTRFDTPREQVQDYGDRVRQRLIPQISAMWKLPATELQKQLMIQTAVCFTNPWFTIDAQVKDQIAQDARSNRRHWENFQVITPDDFTTWVSTLRFGLEKDVAGKFAPYRLTSFQIDDLAKKLFSMHDWTEITYLMPSAQPYGYLLLREHDQVVQHYPLHGTQSTLGRDSTRCTIVVPKAYTRTSRKHLRIVRYGGHVLLQDLESSHGVFVDGTRLSDPIQLRDGQRLTLGGAEPSASVCELLFSEKLSESMQPGATAFDPTTSQSN